MRLSIPLRGSIFGHDKLRPFFPWEQTDLTTPKRVRVRPVVVIHVEAKAVAPRTVVGASKDGWKISGYFEWPGGTHGVADDGSVYGLSSRSYKAVLTCPP